MKINQLSVFLQNKPGSLRQICHLLADHNIDISTMSLADTQDFGIVRLIIKDWEKAKDLLIAGGFGVIVTGVVALEVEDRPGGMCKILDTLDRYAINVEYMYAFVSPVNGKAVVILRFDAPDVAIERLSADHAVNFVCEKDIFSGK